ncbi:Bifunctional ATP-dependent dihydroxyacetone kinase/FAD-AMP lyase (Cyclizing) [Gryllus bimaculatus]|nr:Bifunctional ATP-dependent dihydroxyacetone kinase/FAD-AMP lyase (Cyclizing) [Gryllus bimaculatus]
MSGYVREGHKLSRSLARAMATARAEAAAEAGAGAADRPGGGSRHAACAAACSKRPPPPPPQAPQSPAAGRQEKMAVCKKLVNSPDACVDEMLAGVAAAFPGLDLHAAHRVLLRKQDVPRNKVGILSGGGSGHEPFCAGFAFLH